jgi:hypothetical protein
MPPGPRRAATMHAARFEMIAARTARDWIETVGRIAAAGAGDPLVADECGTECQPRDQGSNQERQRPELSIQGGDPRARHRGGEASSSPSRNSDGSAHWAPVTASPVTETAATRRPIDGKLRR